MLHGEVDLSLDGNERVLSAGDVITIERGMQHDFGSRSGAVIEEISTTHYGEDSFYIDPVIAGEL